MFETKQRRSNFVHEFAGAPEGVVCPTFLVLSAALGCPFKCAYCYLHQTLRYQENTLYSNLDKMEDDVIKWMVNNKRPLVFNMGELSDSMAWGPYSYAVVDKLLPHFKAQSVLGNKYLLLLTKSGNWYNDNTKWLIQSWSLNPFKIVKLYEHGAASITQRLNAIQAAKDKGCRVRIRIDPIIPIAGWEKAYEELCTEINKLEPERVTLGSLRYFKTLPHFAPKSDIWDYGIDNNDPDKRMRLPKDLRIQMYLWITERLSCPEIGLCKETIDVRNWCGFGNPPTEKVYCNCTP